MHEDFAWVSLVGELSWQAGIWGLVLGSAGFLPALALCWGIHRLRWLRRHPKVWNVLAKLTYLVVVLAFTLLGGVGGALYGTQRVVGHNVATYLEPAVASQMPKLRRLLAEHLEPMARNSVITVRDLLQPLLGDLRYRPRSSSWLEQHKVRLINELILRGGAMALTEAFQQGMRHLPQFLPESGDRGQDELLSFTVDTALKMLAVTGEKVDFSPLDQTVPQVFTHAVQRQIHGFYKGLYIGLLIKLLIVLALLGAEILFYFRYWVPRRKRLQAASHETALATPE